MGDDHATLNAIFILNFDLTGNSLFCVIVVSKLFIRAMDRILSWRLFWIILHKSRRRCVSYQGHGIGLV